MPEDELQTIDTQVETNKFVTRKAVLGSGAVAGVGVLAAAFASGASADTPSYAVLGTDGTVGGPSGSPLNASVVLASPNYPLDGAYNLALGSAPPITSATSNVGVGYAALSALRTGLQNYAIGTYSQQSNQSALENISIGYKTLHLNTTGSHNVAIGDEAMGDADGGSSCVAVGKIALKVNGGSWNTAIGIGALAANTTGANNTAVGASAMDALTTGENNVALGYEGGLQLLTGNGNTALGAYAGHTDGVTRTDGAVSHVTLLGYQAQATTSNVIVLGQAVAPRPNLCFGAVGAAANFGGGSGVFFLADAAVLPTSSASGGGIMYSEGGELKWRGPSGLVSDLSSVPAAVARSLADVYIYRDSAGDAVAVSSTGETLATSADHASVFQAAYDSLKGQLGSRINYNGIFTWNSGVIGYSGIALESPGMMDAFANGHASYIQSNISEDILTLELDTSNPGRPSFPNLSGVVLVGNPGMSSQRGIVLSGAAGDLKDVLLDSVGLYEIGGYAIHCDTLIQAWASRVYIEACGGGIEWTKGELRLSQSYIYGSQNSALYALSQTNGSIYITQTKMVSNAGTAMFVSSTASTAVSDSKFTNNGGGTLPQLVVGSNDSTTGISIHDCDFTDTRGASAVRNHITLGTTYYAGLTSIHGCTFSGQRDKAIAATARPHYQVNIHDNPGYNDSYGKIAKAWHSSDAAVAIFGTVSTPSASIAYRASLGPVYIVSSGGSGVSITITNGNGDTIQSGLASYAGVLPFGWSINFGPFSSAPDTVVSVV